MLSDTNTIFFFFFAIFIARCIEADAKSLRTTKIVLEEDDKKYILNEAKQSNELLFKYSVKISKAGKENGILLRIFHTMDEATLSANEVLSNVIEPKSCYAIVVQHHSCTWYVRYITQENKFAAFTLSTFFSAVKSAVSLPHIKRRKNLILKAIYFSLLDCHVELLA